MPIRRLDDASVAVQPRTTERTRASCSDATSRALLITTTSRTRSAHQQIDQGAGVLRARRLAAVAKEVVRAVILQQVHCVHHGDHRCRGGRRRKGRPRPRRGTRRWRLPAAARRCRSPRSAGSRTAPPPTAAAPRREGRRATCSRCSRWSSPRASRRSARGRRRLSRTRSASMFTSLMSLTITATRRPSRLCRTWLSRVVFPAPRKPERTVTGRRLS